MVKLRKELSAKQLHVKQVFRRIKELYLFTSDKQLATYFGLSESFLSQRVGRASIPYELIELVAREKSVSFDYLIDGKNTVYDRTLEDYSIMYEKVLAKAKLYKLIRDEESKQAIKQMLVNGTSALNNDGESKTNNIDELPLAR